MCLTTGVKKGASASLLLRRGRGTIAKPHPDLSFPANRRLKKKREYLRVRAAGKRLYSRHFLVSICDAEHTNSRLGIVVTKKVNKRAVKRNLIKRRIREIFRLNVNRLKGDFDIVVVARNNADQCSFARTRQEILGALYHKGFLDRAL